jgi:hypothetical protein
MKNKVEKIMKSNLSDEEKVERLKKEGLKIIEIANLFNKSYFWVYCRLNKQYTPLKIKNPKEVRA